MLRGFAAKRCVLWLERWLQAKGVGKAPQRCIILAFSWWLDVLDLPVPNRKPAMAAEEWPSSDQVRRRTCATLCDVAVKLFSNAATSPLPAYIAILALLLIMGDWQGDPSLSCPRPDIRGCKGGLLHTYTGHSTRSGVGQKCT